MNADLLIGGVLEDGTLIVSIDGDDALIVVSSDGTWGRIPAIKVVSRDDARAVKLTNEAGRFARRCVVERIVHMADVGHWTEAQIVAEMRRQHLGNNWSNGIATPRTHRQVMYEVNKVRTTMTNR